MKILYLISGIGPPAGWGTEYIQELIFELSKNGIKVTIINPIYAHTHTDWKKWSNDLSKKYGIKIVPIEVPAIIKKNLYIHFLLTPLFVTFQAIKLMRKEKFNAVHEFSSTPIILFRAQLLKILFNVPTIYTLSVYNKTIFGKYFWFKIFDFARYYLIPSKEVMTRIVMLGINKKKVLYSPPGMDLEKFTKLTTKSKARSSLKLPNNKYVIAFFGSLTAEKGVKDILDAMELLKPQLQKKVLICFFTIWKGSNEHNGFKKSILSFNKSSVRLIDEYVNITDVLAAADLVLLPQRTGHCATIPIISVVETLVAKKPVITTSILGNREFVNKSCGMLVPPASPDYLAKAIENYIGKKPNVKKSNQTSQQLINEYSIRYSTKFHLSLYKSLLLTRENEKN